ncbi:MAG: DUF4926 domain-containing protein [Patescibacteria group bacterium]
MTFRELDTAVLDRDLPEHDLRRGDLGAIVHRLRKLLLSATAAARSICHQSN